MTVRMVGALTAVEAVLLLVAFPVCIGGVVLAVTHTSVLGGTVAISVSSLTTALVSTRVWRRMFVGQ